MPERNMELEDIIGFLFFSTIIILLYSMSVLYRHSSEIWFEKRARILIWSHLLISGFTTIILQPMTIFGETNLIPIDLKTIMIFQNILTFCWFYLCKYSVAMLIQRTILIFVNVERAKQSDHDWKSAIDPNYDSDHDYNSDTTQKKMYKIYKNQSSWVLKYFYILGNQRYLLLFFTLYCLFEIICGFIVVLIDNGTFGDEFLRRFGIFFIVNGILGTVQVSICGYFVYKVSKSLLSHVSTFDSLFIAKELKLNFWSMFVAILISIIGMILAFTQFDDPSNRRRHVHIATTVPISVYFAFSWYLSTVWVHNKNRNKLKSTSGDITLPTILQSFQSMNVYGINLWLYCNMIHDGFSLWFCFLLDYVILATGFFA